MMNRAFSLEGKTVFVTGASSGIGRGIAVGCARAGAKLILNGRDRDRLKETLSILDGEEHSIIVGDLSCESDIISIVENLPEIHGWVNSAAIPKVCPIKYFDKNNIEEIFSVNIISTMLLMLKLLKTKKIKRGASIVLISAITGAFVGSRGDTSYCATKGAVNGFMKGAALELASLGIRVNTVNPGLVPTNILKLSDQLAGESHHTELMFDQYPLKRLGTPEDIANGVIYLLSDASSWVTGHALAVDGGYLLQ